MRDLHWLEQRVGRREFVQAISAAGAMTALDGICGILNDGAFSCDGTLRDGCWLYGHDSGDHDGLGNNPMNFYNVPMSPELPVAEAAHGFGIRNVCVCRWGLTDEEYIRQYRGLKRVSWAITGSRNTRYSALLEHNFALLEKLPNLVAFDLDDYFRKKVPGTDEKVKSPNGDFISARAALPYFELQRLRRRMHARRDRSLALQLVVYDYMLREEMRPVFDSVDFVQYWTWCGKDVRDLSKRFQYYRKLAPHKPTFLGIYMWDYGNRKPLELSFMKQQLEVGFDLWKKGEIEGFVFHCSNLLNKKLPPAEYARAWFAEHADVTRVTAVYDEVRPMSEIVLESGFVNVPDLSVSGARMLEIRAEMDRNGKSATELRVGGDEWLPFSGQTGRQLLACGTKRVLIVEPSGRVVWKHDGCGNVTCARLDGRTVYYSNGSLRRVLVALPCDPRAEDEIVYRGPTDANDVRGFDFTSDGTIVLAAGEYIVELNTQTFVPLLWIRVGLGVRMVRKTRTNTYLAVFDNAVREYDATGALVSEILVEGCRVGDALRVLGDKTLISCGDEIREYAADGKPSKVFFARTVSALAGARFGSLQRLASGDVIVGIDWGVPPRMTMQLAAIGITKDGKVSWSVSSSSDAGLPCAQKIQSREEYD